MTFKQRFNYLGRSIYLALLVLGTVTIMLRRWSWGQEPTQLAPLVVYLTLLVNCCWIALLIHRWARSEALTKRGKS